ncbi:MAG: adenylate/guanylate cyclase domain-containing protein [Candidatus Binatia bacterium]
MHCTNCGTELIAGKRFCHICGTQVSLTCPNCGSTIEPGFRFCPDCGFRLTADHSTGSKSTTAGESPTDQPPNVLAKHIPAELAQKIRASTGAIAGERKLVTVMFCDVAGSTAIAERLDPEEYHELLEQYLALAFREIYRLEGIVNQLAGDGMMALFGAPLAHENAPERAVEAALAIRDALSTLNQQLSAERGLTLRARIGIHTGPVVVGTVGNDFKMDYTAIGDTTNLASRLESLAEPGTVLVSEATERLVRGLFEMRPVGPFEVKGKREAVTAFEVLRRNPLTTPMAIAAERGLTPLVGRDEELAQLTACFERLTGDLTQIVAVVGPAGSGKSRLLYEFKRRLDGQRVVFFEGRCASLNQVVPYAVWINMLRQYFDLSPTELSGCACEKMLAKIPESDETLRELFPYLCRLLALPAEPLPDVPLQELQSKTFEVVARLVMAASNRAPVIMLLEDLQWIDEPSREMLDLAVSHLRGRIMLVVSHRPDYQPAWRTHAAFTQLNLRPLSDEHTAEIIRALAGGRLPAELERRILVKAEGNPFVAEEITRDLLEQGVVLRGDDQVRLTRPVADVRIPDTVQELIGARLDRLGPQGKRVVQVAAVLGRQFQRSQLEALLDGEGIDVGAQLELLEGRGIIHRKDLLSRDEFRFGESLTQEVAYEALLLKERRHLHARIGRLLEAVAGELTAERSALIAHHYALGDDREKALAALLRAAHQAEQLPSYPVALRFYRDAWQLADAALPETQGATGTGAAAVTAPVGPASVGLVPVALEAALGLCRVVILYGSSEAAEIERPVRRARAWAEALGNAEALAGACTYQGLMIMSGARAAFADGVPLVEEGFAVAQRAGLTVTAISISRALAVAYVYDGRCDLGQETLRWAVAELERLGEKDRLSDLYLSARYMRDSLRCMCDDLEGAEQGVTETYEQAVRASNRTVQSLAASILAWVHFARAQYGEARRWADTSLEVAEVIGNVATIRTAAALALAARASAGEAVGPSRYIELIEQGYAARSDMAVKCYLVVEAFLAIGEADRARRFAEIAYGHAGGRLRQAWCATARGDIMLRLGPRHWAEAERWYQQALGLAEAIGARSALATAALGAGELALAQGDEDSGQRSFRQALAIAGEIGFARLQTRAQKLLEACNGPKRRAGSPSSML